ncbi:MAG TPA: NAD(P)H-dependent oxidoreductase [Gemmatimonadaceae bacterium]
MAEAVLTAAGRDALASMNAPRFLSSVLASELPAPLAVRTQELVTMPKVLVLFHSRSGTAALAEAVAEGAASVKFTEVELRRIEDLASAAENAGTTSRHRVLESVESLADYDGLIIGVEERDGRMVAEVRAVLDRARQLASRGSFVDKVGAAFGAGDEGASEAATNPIIASMMHLGMLIVPPGSGDAKGARALGARVAKVTEWVRHAKSHEHGHKHAH